MLHANASWTENLDVLHANASWTENLDVLHANASGTENIDVLHANASWSENLDVLHANATSNDANSECQYDWRRLVYSDLFTSDTGICYSNHWIKTTDSSSLLVLSYSSP